MKLVKSSMQGCILQEKERDMATAIEDLSMCNHLPTSAYGGGVSAESHCGAGWGAGSTPLERVPGIPDIFLYSKDALVSVIILIKSSLCRHPAGIFGNFVQLYPELNYPSNLI